ncbi:hypothetical protein GCM10010129_11820 [Streptomyces fumigatiscleroticus]|nr:hypothetical protein GCM10010129_11820 [Streptomyces fumigatiscleroticus]
MSVAFLRDRDGFRPETGPADDDAGEEHGVSRAYSVKAPSGARIRCRTRVHCQDGPQGSCTVAPTAEPRHRRQRVNGVEAWEPTRLRRRHAAAVLDRRAGTRT